MTSKLLPRYELVKHIREGNRKAALEIAGAILGDENDTSWHGMTTRGEYSVYIYRDEDGFVQYEYVED